MLLMGTSVLLVFGVFCGLLSQCQSKHLLQFLTFCQKNDTDDGEYEVGFDRDELFSVDPVTYRITPRLPEFAEQFPPQPDIAFDVHDSVGTCKYNIPRAIKGEKTPPEAIEPPTSQVYSKLEVVLGIPNVLICLVNDFHPTPVDITWAKNNEELDRSLVTFTQYYSNKDFSFRIFSYLSFTPLQGDIYSCNVGHISLQKPLTKFFEINVRTDSEVVETMVSVVGVTLGLIGVATGVWFIIKANKSLRTENNEPTGVLQNMLMRY